MIPPEFFECYWDDTGSIVAYRTRPCNEVRQANALQASLEASGQCAARSAKQTVGFDGPSVPQYHCQPRYWQDHRFAVESKLAPIRKGLLEFLVLKIVGTRSAYVPDILRRLAGTEFATQEGTLYPLLSKLRREDLVQYEWQESDAGPPRKYYRLTDAGRTQLQALNDYWAAINRTIADIGH